MSETNGNDRLDRIEKAVESLSEKMASGHKELSTLIENTSQSLQREMQEGFRTFNSRQDRIETRLDLQAGKITSGTRWIARSDEWQSRIDNILAEQAKEIGELRERLRKLEGGAQ